MPRNKPFINVSAVVPPSVAEEIDRLAAANKVTRSQMVRQLLEEKLTERANRRLNEEKDKIEERLQKIENRFSSLMVKVGRAAAQNLYLTMHQVSYDYEKPAADKLWSKSQEFAGNWLKQSSKPQESDDQ